MGQEMLLLKFNRRLVGVLCLCLLSVLLVTPEFGVADSQPAVTTPLLKGEEMPQKQPDEGIIEVTVEDAILLTLENNRSLKVERINPSIQQTFEQEERSVFDPLLTGEAAGSREKVQRISTAGNIFENTINRTDAGMGISRYFSTGTRIDIDISIDRLYSDLSPDQHSPRFGVSITQALLQGRGFNVNLATLRQARLDTSISGYELRGFAEALIAQVEETYWDYYLAEQQVDIYLESLRLAELQIEETEERINVGILAETEIIAAQAEIALRQEDLINARSTMEKTHLRLLQMLNPPGTDFWKRKILLLDMPAVPELKLDPVESHVAVALRLRPDLNQARMEVQQSALELIKTRNGLLPKMDLFITLGKTGYAESFSSSVESLDKDYYDASAGIRFEFPFGNRDARARHQRAVFSREQAAEALENLAQLMEVDVRSAYIEVNRTRQQITATAATRKLQEEKLRIETEKYRVGRSTMFLVAEAQHDLVTSQIAEVEAVVNHLKSLIELYRLGGSLLERRGILVPGITWHR